MRHAKLATTMALCVYVFLSLGLHSPCILYLNRSESPPSSLGPIIKEHHGPDDTPLSLLGRLNNLICIDMLRQFVTPIYAEVCRSISKHLHSK